MKDLITLVPNFKAIHDKAQMIVSKYKTSPLQYARLREIQIEKDGKPNALVLSVITRWGTQYKLITSLLKNKDALWDWSCRYGGKERGFKEVESYISDFEFWGNLDRLEKVLKPIDKVLRQSESQEAHLGLVLERWNEICEVLQQQQQKFPELNEFMSSNGPFSKRYKLLKTFY